MVVAEHERPDGGIRGRFRAQVRDEVKAAALAQLEQGGPQAVSVNAIARQLGVSGPALYRYFSGREELVTALVVDAYTDLAATVSTAATGGAAAAPAGGAPGDRVRAVARAYRRWALDQPHRYRLLFTPPLPGVDAHAPALVEAAQASMAVLLDVLTPLAPRLPAPGSAELARQLERVAGGSGDATDPGVALAAVRLWSRLHGLVGLELGGNTSSMGLDVGLLLDVEVAALFDAQGTAEVTAVPTAAPDGPATPGRGGRR